MQAHPAEKGQSQDLTRVCLSPRSVLLTSTVYSLHSTGVTGAPTAVPLGEAGKF